MGLLRLDYARPRNDNNMPILDTAKNEFRDAIEFLKKDLSTLRTGRATPALVEDVSVEAYGAKMPLKGAAAISAPDARTISIEPWDKSLVKEIERALLESNLGIMPVVAGTVIRLVMPKLTEETRKNLIKIMGQKVEQGRISLRRIRDKARETIVAEERSKNIAEDERYRLQEQLDKLMGEMNDAVKKIAEEKEKEIMTI